MRPRTTANERRWAHAGEGANPFPPRRTMILIRAPILALAAVVPTTALAAPPPLYPLPPRYDHVVVVILENVNPEQVIGSPAAPYINTLADDGVSFDRLYAFK